MSPPTDWRWALGYSTGFGPAHADKPRRDMQMNVWKIR